MPEQQPSKKTPVYLLSIALVTSAGLNLAQYGIVAEARAGISEPKLMEARIVIARSELAGVTNQQVANGLCAKINKTYGLTGGGVCTLADLLGWDVVLNDFGQPDANEDGVPDNAVVTGQALKGGTWAPGEPQ